MKAIHLILPMLALTITGLVAQKPAKQPRQIVVDFRVERRSTPLKIPIATQRKVLSKVFRKYLTEESKCNPQFDASSDIDTLKAARNAGQIVPSIADMATGSFTAPGKTDKRVAIFSGQELFADVDSDFNINIVRKTDLNDDGIDELLMTGGDINQGIVVEMASLLDFQNGRLRIIQDFGTVVEDSCPSGMPGSSSKASVLSISEVVPGNMPKLRIDNYVATCRNARRCRFLSTGKMPE